MVKKGLLHLFGLAFVLSLVLSQTIYPVQSQTPIPEHPWRGFGGRNRFRSTAAGNFASSVDDPAIAQRRAHPMEQGSILILPR